MEEGLPPLKIYDNKVSFDVRKEALRAIKTGKNLEAVSRANQIADEINKESIYKGPYYSTPARQLFELI